MSSLSNAEQTAMRILAEIAGVAPDEVSTDQDLVAHLGIDSPRALQLTVEIEDALGIEIEDEDLAELRTVEDVLRAVRRRAEPSS